MKKRILVAIFCATMALSLTACAGNSTKPENNTQVDSSQDANEEKKTITIKSYDGNKNIIDVEVPYNPQRIAILDFPSLDILAALEKTDRVVGSADTSIEYLSAYTKKDGVANIGTIKEADLEAIMESEPDVIFIGGRLATVYESLKEIAPVVYLGIDSDLGVVESVRSNATTIASMFGEEEKVADLMADFDQRIATLQEVAKDKKAIIGMTTSGSFNLLANEGRCTIIGNEIGFNNIGAPVEEQGGSSATHGNEASFELVASLNPDYMFILDRDSAIGAEGAQLAQQIIENELVKGTDTYKNGNIVYLANPAVWYTAEGGITALDIMLSDLESALLK